MNSPFFADFIINKSSVMYLLLDNKGNILEHNAIAEQITGRSLNNASIFDIVVDFTLNFDFKKLLSSDTATKINIATAYGIPETFYFYFYPKEKHIVAFAQTNYHDTMLLRKEMVDINNELSTLTRELYKKNAELQKMNEVKNHFLSVAAHDLRNPMSNVMSFAEILLFQLKSNLSDKHVKYLKTIYKLGADGINLLNELLDLIKIESGSLRLKISTFNMSEAIKDCIFLQQVQADQKNIKILFSQYDSNIEVEADWQAISQVLNNLLSNALKYSFSNTKVQVGMFVVADNITVFVKDQGQGIPKEEMEKLFQPFYTTSVKPTGGEKSTGLGLVIAKRIIAAHAGKIWLESKQGEGTTVYFSLPLPLRSTK